MSDPTAIVVSDPYLIVEVQPKWALETETMGSKPKFWYRSPAPQADWLFKHPQLHTGQHWAEKIAAEIAALLAIRHAKVELAVFSEQRGSATESFTRGGRELIHGNQMLARVVHGYDREKTFGQSSHTLANIWQVMDRAFVRSEAARRAKLCMAEYMVLDALIGNTDRHHENWGVVRKRAGGHWRGMMIAPSFDHASSLGRELPDTHRERLLTENRVGKYAEKGRGALYWSEDERHGPSPLELVRRAAHKYPDLFRKASRKLERVDEAELRQIVARIPPDWMTPLSRVFALALVCYNFEQLQELFR